MADSGTDDVYSRFDNASNGWTDCRRTEVLYQYRALCASACWRAVN